MICSLRTQQERHFWWSVPRNNWY